MYVALSVTAWRMVAVVVVSVSVVVADVDVEEDGCCRTFAVCGDISSVHLDISITCTSHGLLTFRFYVMG